jgi:hypothetical protein
MVVQDEMEMRHCALAAARLNAGDRVPLSSGN